MKRNNLGFTMVEMITAVCILSIISVMLIMFISAGTVNYTKTGNNVNIQKESQMAMNQITELLIDATNGVTYSVNDTLVDSDDHFIMATATNIDHKTVCVFNRVAGLGGSDTFVRSEIKWEEGSKKLLYSEYKLEKTPSGSYNSTPLEENSILAENVNSFSVDLRKVAENNTVTVKMGFVVKNQNFDANKTITLRNNIVINKGLDETFESKEAVLNPTVEDVILNPSSVYVEQGTSYNGFQVTVVGKNAPGQEVEWEIANPAELTDPSDTSIGGDGKLKIGSKETCEVIKVKATSLVSKRLAAGDTSKYVSETVEVYNKYIRSGVPLTITDVKAGADLKASAMIHVNGVNFEGNEDYSNLIDIEIYDGEQKLSGSEVKVEPLTKMESDSINEKSSYKLTLAGSEDYLNKPLTIKATIDGKGSAEAEFEFKRATLSEIRIEARDEEGSWAKYRNGETRTSKRGETIEFRLVGTYTFDDGTEELKTLTSADSEWGSIDWTAAFDGGSALGDKATNNLDSSGTIAISSSPDIFGYKSEYEFYVNAQYGGKTAKAKILLPKVQMNIINQHADTQTRVGIVVGDSGNRRAATVRFQITGLLPSQDMIQYNLGSEGKLEVERISGTNEFNVYTYSEGTASVVFYLRDDSGVSVTLDVAAYKPNVKDGSTTLPYYVPSDNASRVFFNEAQKDYYDLYGNTFLYPTKGKMEFNGDIYEYDSDVEAWVKQ